MALPPNYTNFTPPAIDAGNLNTLNLVNYQLLGNGVDAPSTRLELISNLGISGRLLGIKAFTASGTYTPTTGTNTVYVVGVGAGGGGGGVAACTAGNVVTAAGGGAGGVGATLLTGVGTFTGTTVTIGSAGAGGVGNNPGSSGGLTSFGSFLALGAGVGGSTGPLSTVSFANGGDGGNSATGNVYLGFGADGDSAICAFAAGYALSGRGGDSTYGSGGRAVFTGAGGAAGRNATGRGAGGSGACNFGLSSPQNGGAGFTGIILIYEYS